MTKSVICDDVFNATKGMVLFTLRLLDQMAIIAFGNASQVAEMFAVVFLL